MGRLDDKVAVVTGAGQGIGLGLNLGAASAILLPPEALDWLAGAVAEVPVT